MTGGEKVDFVQGFRFGHLVSDILYQNRVEWVKNLVKSRNFKKQIKSRFLEDYWLLVTEAERCFFEILNDYESWLVQLFPEKWVIAFGFSIFLVGVSIVIFGKSTFSPPTMTDIKHTTLMGMYSYTQLRRCLDDSRTRAVAARNVVLWCLFSIRVCHIPVLVGALWDGLME